MARVSIKLSARDIRTAVNRKVKGPILALTKNPDVLYSIAEEAMRIVTPYVPYKSGNLSRSGYIKQTSREVQLVWGQAGIGDTMKYARYQYYADDSFWNRTRDVHPLATSYWTDVIERGTPGFSKLVAYAAPLMQKEVQRASR